MENKPLCILLGPLEVGSSKERKKEEKTKSNNE
jgi:hypothetical protein